MSQEKLGKALAGCGGDGIETIVRLGYEATFHDVDGRRFLPDGDGGFVEARTDYQADMLEVYTLSGFVGFVKKNLDDLDLDKLLVHVKSATRVELVSALSERFRERDVYLAARYSSPLATANLGFGWGRWLDLEAFNIALQTLFAAPERVDVTTQESVGPEFIEANDRTDRNRVLALVGNVRDGRVSTTSDDGVTQTVEAKVGITRMENAEVPNPVALAPFRTFGEVEQPISPFVLRLRLRSGAGADKVTAALFEADGGAWEAVAIDRILTYLRAELPSELAVIG